MTPRIKWESKPIEIFQNRSVQPLFWWRTRVSLHTNEHLAISNRKGNTPIQQLSNWLSHKNNNKKGNAFSKYWTRAIERWLLNSTQYIAKTHPNSKLKRLRVQTKYEKYGAWSTRRVLLEVAPQKDPRWQHHKQESLFRPAIRPTRSLLTVDPPSKSTLCNQSIDTTPPKCCPTFLTQLTSPNMTS